jgi:hypothetical protein
MALTKENLVIGKVVYKLDVLNNSARRNKITMTDVDGNQWYRYDQPLWSYKVIPMTIVGIVKHVVRGVIDADANVKDEYFLQLGKEKYVNMFTEEELITDNYGRNFYDDETRAIDTGESMCVNRNI